MCSRATNNQILVLEDTSKKAPEAALPLSGVGARSIRFPSHGDRPWST
jgi:hypothetical protein